MSPNEIKNAYLGYYEKRIKMQMLFAEIGNIATDASSMMLPEKNWATHYPLSEFNLTVIETVYSDIFVLINDNMELLERLMKLRNLSKQANSRIKYFLGQAILPMTDTEERNKEHNKYLESMCNRIITEAGETMKLLGPYRL